MTTLPEGLSWSEALNWARSCSTESLISDLKNKKNSFEIRLMAASGLEERARANDSRAFNALVSALDDKSEKIRRAVTMLLSNIHTHRTLKSLTKAMRMEEIPFVKQAMISSIQRIKWSIDWSARNV